MRGEITRPAEIERMAEREQADIADQQIERAGEQREAQRLHQKDGIDAREGRHGEQRGHHRNAK